GIVREFLGAVENFGLWEQQGLAIWADGGLLLTSGRAGEAVTRLREAIALMQQAGTMRSALIASTDLARAEAIAGTPARARATLEPALRDDLPLFDVGAKALQAQGWIHAAEGDLTAAAETFLAAADAYAAAGHSLPELASLEEAARAGFAEAAAERVESLAGRMEGAYAALCIRHVRALARLTPSPSDPALGAELDGIGDAAAGMLLHLTAADAYAEAAAVHRGAGDSRAAAASDRRATGQLQLCGVERSPLREALATALVVSGREREIAELAIEGLSDREIAARLVLSVRTVETHLQRLYRKTGVRRRDELGAALGTAPPDPI
ncbi:MAG: helix-turn-helix transcriptional regulator, partial [Herbiconiux sp.]|nr:helix-turn-helix transcriptional regulator [Herbiconiux sp.]